MREFKLFILSITVMFNIIGCSSNESTSANSLKKSSSSCPKCNMHIDETKHFTASFEQHDFDDIGCLVLYSKDNNIDLKNSPSKVFTNDTHRYIDSMDAYYKTDEITPMNYGFGAYEHKILNTIDFNELILRMLRGENMSNPKIRKQILGDKA